MIPKLPSEVADITSALPQDKKHWLFTIQHQWLTAKAISYINLQLSLTRNLESACLTDNIISLGLTPAKCLLPTCLLESLSITLYLLLSSLPFVKSVCDLSLLLSGWLELVFCGHGSPCWGWWELQHNNTTWCPCPNLHFYKGIHLDRDRESSCSVTVACTLCVCVCLCVSPACASEAVVASVHRDSVSDQL